MSLLQNAIAAGLAAIRTAAGQPIVYSRGTTTIPIPLAVKAKGSLDSHLEDAVLEGVTVTDWILDARLLPWLPAPMDRITATISGVDQVFDVVKIPNFDCFQYSDEGHTTLRVHTQRIQ